MKGASGDGERYLTFQKRLLYCKKKVVPVPNFLCLFFLCLQIDEWTVPSEVAFLNHLAGVKGVVQLRDYWVKEQRHYLVMDKPENAIDLFDYVTHVGKVDEKTARDIFFQVLHILYRVRLRGIFHLDIKEENILINPDTKEVWLIDFDHGHYYDGKQLSRLPGERFPCLLTARESMMFVWNICLFCK